MPFQNYQISFVCLQWPYKWAPPQGKGEGDGGYASPNQKVRGNIMSYAPPPPNYDDSAVTVISPALKRALHLYARLSPAGP